MSPDKDIEKTLAAFYDKISHPVLSNIRLKVPSAKAYGILPGTIPDLFRGEQLVIVGRYRKSGSTLIRLDGTLGDKKKTYDFEAKLPKDDTTHNFIPRLWAKRQVGVLLEQIRLGGEKQALVDEVVQLGTAYGIVTPYTSYLITEPGYQAVRPRPPMRPMTTKGAIRGGIGGSDRNGRFDEEKAEKTAIAMDKDAFAMQSGASAVKVAKKVKAMKEADVADDIGGTVRSVGDRTFRWTSGRWMDDDAAKLKARTIKIKPYSQAWFDLAAASKRIARYLSLGDHVTFAWKGVIVEVSEGGAEILPADLEKLL